MPDATEPVSTLHVDQLEVRIYEDGSSLARAAADDAAARIEEAVRDRGEATVVVATGNSQLPYIRALRAHPRVDWSRVRIVMVDQYLGVDEARLGTLVFLEEHLLRHVEPLEVLTMPSQVADPVAFAADYEAALRRHPADLASLGWGENGHLAFNDPHNADFDDPVWVKRVALSDESRRQPVGEGRFPSLDDVPTHAITLTIPALLSSRHILCIVPEARKAPAVRRCLEEAVSPSIPGSVLRTVPNAVAYLELASAAQLRGAAGD